MISISDDHASLEAGKYTFYYGYEYMHCKNCKNFIEHETTCEECEEYREWAFEAKRAGKTVLSLSLEDLTGRDKVDEFDSVECLLMGIALAFEKLNID